MVKANTEDEVLRQAAQHAGNVHGVDVTPEMAQQIRGLIEEERE